MGSLRFRISSIEFNLREMGYSEGDDAHKYATRLKEIIIGSKANNRDRLSMLKYLGHLIHQLPNQKRMQDKEELCHPVLDENLNLYRFRWFCYSFHNKLYISDVYAPSREAAIEIFRNHIDLKVKQSVYIKSIEKASFSICGM